MIDPSVSSGELNWQRTRDPELLVKRLKAYEDRVETEVNGKHPLKGRTPRNGDVILRSNDYLCLSADQRVIDAEIDALKRLGHGDISARTWTQNQDDEIRTFERRLGRLMGEEDSVVCTSGYTANIGLIQSLAGPDTSIYLDMKAHMSFWEGVRSAGATPTAFRHNQPENLERKIEKSGAGLIVVDALYSTDGALCPLSDFVDIARRHGCIMIVDETHSFGTIGPSGAGLTSALNLEHGVHFRTLGLSKAVSSRGGAVVCSERSAEYFRNSALPQIFSTSVLPYEVAGYSCILDIFASDHWRRQKLHSNHAQLRHGLDKLGYNVDSSDAQIIALEAGDLRQTIILRDALEVRGIFGAIFFPPATPEKRCLIRLSVNCKLTGEQIERVLDTCRVVRGETGMDMWRSTRRRKGISRGASYILSNAA